MKISSRLTKLEKHVEATSRPDLVVFLSPSGAGGPSEDRPFTAGDQMYTSREALEADHKVTYVRFMPPWGLDGEPVVCDEETP